MKVGGELHWPTQNKLLSKNLALEWQSWNKITKIQLLQEEPNSLYENLKITFFKKKKCKQQIICLLQGQQISSNIDQVQISSISSISSNKFNKFKFK